MALAAVLFVPFMFIAITLVVIDFVADKRREVRWNIRRAAGLVRQFVVDYPSLFKEDYASLREATHD